jgi:AcrR family transcriptional regulator
VIAVRDNPFEGFGPRAVAKMEELELAALHEFVERGFEDTTAERIAGAAGASVRTFYRYFPRGKDDVMVLQFRRWVSQLAEAMRTRPASETAWVALREAVRVIPLLDERDGISRSAVLMHRQLAHLYPGLHQTMTGHHHGLAEPIVEMAALRMAVDPRLDIRPRLMVHAMLAAAMVTWLAWLADAEISELNAFAAFEEALDVLGVGMTTGT